MKDYKRLTDRVTAEMLRNTEGESWDSNNIEAQCYIRLAELEDKIERGELVPAAEDENARRRAEVAERAVREFAVQVGCRSCPYKGRCGISNPSAENDYQECYEAALRISEEDLAKEGKDE